MAIQINGTTGISGVDGSATTPALQGQDTNTGISFGTDEVNVVTGGTTRATFDSSGRLLVGTTSAPTSSTQSHYGKLIVSGSSAGNTHAYAAFITGSTAETQGPEVSRLVFGNTNAEYGRIDVALDGTAGTSSAPGRMVFYTTASGATSPTERLRITSDGTFQLRNSPGIDFSQIQTNATGVISETLDSFEHGTWEARLRFGNTTEIGTYSTNSSAEYVKIGNIVHVSGFTRYDSVNTGNTGILTMDLPFGVDEHGQPHNWVYPGSAVPSHSDLMTKGFHALCGNASGARSRFGFYNSTSGSIDYVENGDLSSWNGNTRYLHFNFSYQTNA